MANTIIQIKRSQTTALPSSLNYGELAYSFQSGKIAIGDATTGVVVIGGNTYTQMLDAATSANTSSTIVKRDSDGSFSATVVNASLWGNANTATKFQTARDIYLFGDASGVSSFDGTANADIAITLATVNSNVGTFGGASQIPVFTVNGKGLVTAAANVSIATTLNVNGDTGSDAIDLLTDTLTLVGGDGITTVANNDTDTVTFDVDNTVIRTSGGQTIGGDLTVSGDLTVLGNTVTVNTSSLFVEDSLIKLANNNISGDGLDIGFYGTYNDSGVKFSGLARTISDSKQYFLFKDLDVDPTANTIPSESITVANTATLRANVTGGVISSLHQAIQPSDGGTGLRSYTVGDIIFANGSTTLTVLNDIAVGNVLISGGVGTAPSYGKVGLATHVADILPIAHGGTNASTIGTAGSVAYSNGTSYVFNTAGTTGQAFISGGSGAPTFGTLDLLGGGLGFTNPNANSAVFYSGTGNAMSYTNSASDGHVLQYDSATGVKFSHLDGGNF
jgi:hypothetical protein